MEALKGEVEDITLVDPKETENTKPLEKVAPIFIHSDYPDRHVMIRNELTAEHLGGIFKKELRRVCMITRRCPKDRSPGHHS